MGRLSARAGLVVVLSLAAAAMVGCGTLNTQKNTYIQVQCSGNTMMHLAIVPRVLPDGTPAGKQRDKLLKDVADAAGGYTLIPSVMRAWKTKDMTGPAKETADDLLLVEGPPELAMGLRQRLHDDFGQAAPFVLSLPIQSIFVTRTTPNPLKETPKAAGQAPAPAMEGPAPAQK